MTDTRSEGTDVRDVKLVVAEEIFRHFATTPCIRALLGEDSDGCGCMSCASAGFLATTPEQWERIASSASSPDGERA